MTTSAKLVASKASASSRVQKFNQRNRTNKIALALSLFAMCFGIFWLIWILWETIRLGISGLTVATLTQMTPPPNEIGGIANAI